MGNFSGVSPKWISRENAGSNPAYPEQLNKNLKLEKDLEVELGVFNNWKKAESGLYYSKSGEEFTEGDLAAFNRIGRPFLVSIGSSDSSQSFSVDLASGSKGVLGADVYTNWVPSVDGGYIARIPYKVEPWGGHRKGFVKGDLADLENKSSFIIPKVKTYSYTGQISGDINSGDIGFEEVYDSAEVNIRTGEVVLRSDILDPVYLVVIY